MMHATGDSAPASSPRLPGFGIEVGAASSNAAGRRTSVRERFGEMTRVAIEVRQAVVANQCALADLALPEAFRPAYLSVALITVGPGSPS